MHNGYHSYFPPNHYYAQSQPSSSYNPQPQIQQPQTQIYGLVVGYNKYGNRNYLFYTKNIDGFVEISGNIQSLQIGRWLKLTVCQNFVGQYVLDSSNSCGYENWDVLPNHRNSSARFFPKYEANDEGEILITARFDVIVDRKNNLYDFTSYDISYDHIIDDFSLIKSSCQHYDGRSFIVEAQASLAGWVALSVHEDPQKLHTCDAVSRNGYQSLPNPVVDSDVQYLHDTRLLDIMTGNGYVQTPETDVQDQQSSQHQEDVHSQMNSQTSDSYNSSRVVSENREIPPETFRSQSIELNQVDSSLSQTTISSRAAPVIDSNQLSDEDEIDDEDTYGTRGTSNIPMRPFIKDLAPTMLQLLRQDKTDSEKPQSALCTVVQKIDGFAILYTAKRDVINVLLQERSCEGLERSPQLGDVAFFDILPRRIETKDRLIFKIPYTHIAVKKKPDTPDSLLKIDCFKNSVRCFGGVLEMKVKIALSKPELVVEQYHDNTEMNSDHHFYYLKATNGVLVTIPKERLLNHLNSKLSADFDLIAWVVHRKPIGNVSLHIGKGGEAYQQFTNGDIRELPPLSSNQYFMNVRK
ncbi:SH2 domain-containing protein [Caenorhabditis elegans]|uniref:SH2 domain-containing protein n=1 Tax=Caenorhabditis elegans TaxID=6239 RepID=Q19672_CAEEL|nr:SH2 domain-containing protein [Caenorhabditis elegans]CAA95803.3 SH2 domain-containing protein [Caenorhabditis elegans]|eukprot:NP_001021398.1 Uncharacterized protein CELE_F21C3.4 [Caenorhabditis elegans]